MTTLTIELLDITTEQLKQHNISEEQLATIVHKIVQLYLRKPQLREGLRDLVTILFDGHKVESNQTTDLETAATILLPDYQHDTDLTAFTCLDSENFYA
jgi:hypothetical protein